jgi:hypothetical protein
MHQRVLQHVNHLERQRVNQEEPQPVNQAAHQHVNHLEYQQMNHLLYASKTHHRVQAVSQLEFLHLHVSQTIIINDPNPVQTEHPVIVVVLVEVVPEEAVVLVGVVLEEAVVEDGNNHFIYLKLHSKDLKGKTETQFYPWQKTVVWNFFESDSELK